MSRVRNEEQKARKAAYEKARYAAQKAEDPEGFREKAKLKARRRRKTHKESINAYDRARYARDWHLIKDRRRKEYAENKNGVRDRILAYQRHRRRAGNVNYRLRAALAAAKARAKKRGLEFNLRVSDFGDVTHCAVTGIEFDLTNSFRQGNIFVPSLDRIDPSKGYVKGNVRVVCHGYNLAKHTGRDEDVLKLARAIVARADQELP